MSKAMLDKEFVGRLLVLWTEFESWWYSPRLGQYADDPKEPTITDFFNWLTESES